jgi:hypothetical protein
VQFAGHDFLADTALAGNQDADLGVGHALDHRHHFAHGGTGRPAGLAAIGFGRCLSTEPRHFVRERQFFDRIANRAFERGFAESAWIVRLDDVINGAETHRIDDRGGHLLARQHDDGHAFVGRVNRAQCLETVHAWHQHVEQHDLGT